MTSEKKSFLLGQLQEAIDQAVSESGRICDIIEEMKRGGYDLCLMLESTVTISANDEYQPEAVLDAGPGPRLISDAPAADGEIELTDADLEFLQELNIAA
jgi:hypothetical protein